MKVFIIPKIGQKEDNSAYYICQNLIDALRQEGHDCAVSSDPNSGIKRATFYPYAKVPTSLFKGFKDRDDYKTYESYLYTTKQSNGTYLKEDVQLLEKAIEQYHPDLIIDLGRLAAPIVAHIKEIPFFSYVSGAIYRQRSNRKKDVKAINETLASFETEQILSITDLYDYADARFTFGTPLSQPFPEDVSVLRFGSIEPPVENNAKDVTVSIYLTDTQQKPSLVKEIVDNSFMGAPYDVHVLTKSSELSHEQNMKYLSSIKVDDLLGSSICIHDGNDYLTNLCMMLAIPQIVVNDGSYLRSWNASAITRNGLGLSIPESELSVQSLYETYRRIITDDYYKTKAILMKNDLLELPELSQFAKLL